MVYSIRVTASIKTHLLLLHEPSYLPNDINCRFIRCLIHISNINCFAFVGFVDMCSNVIVLILTVLIVYLCNKNGSVIK